VSKEAHTCINTATTADGSVPPPCPACMLKAVSGLAGVIEREGHAACAELYPKRDPGTLEPRLSRHMFALSMGTLVGDDAIAEQLAWRDKRIAQLEAERVHLLAIERIARRASRSHGSGQLENLDDAKPHFIDLDAARRAK